MLDDGNDEPPVQRNGYAEVDLLSINDVGPRDGRIHHRECLQALRYRFDDEGHVGELLAGCGFELRTFLRTNAGDPREVDLYKRCDVRGGLARGHHVVADERAHLGHWLNDIA